MSTKTQTGKRSSRPKSASKRKGSKVESVAERVEQAINHCGISGKMKRNQMTKEDVMEAVLDRAGVMVANLMAGKGHGKAHENEGVELLSISMANSIIEAGAKRLADDFEIDLKELQNHATSRHISSC